MNRIYLASDHGGFELKEYIKTFLAKTKYEIVDLGTDSENSVDYPEYGFKLGTSVVEDKNSLGIAVCGSGIGISIACNKVNGVRCALLSDVKSAALCKEHNNANIIALGGRIISKELAEEIVNTWLTSTFEGGRHENRVTKFREYEESR